jgi:hypothetical protein
LQKRESTPNLSCDSYDLDSCDLVPFPRLRRRLQRRRRPFAALNRANLLQFRGPTGFYNRNTCYLEKKKGMLSLTKDDKFTF